MEDSVVKTFAVEKPATEAELGLVLRAKALAAKALDLTVLDGEARRNYILKRMLIGLGDEDGLPSIIGVATEVIGGVEFNAGAGRVNVLDPEETEDKRRLTFTLTEVPFINDDQPIDLNSL